MGVNYAGFILDTAYASQTQENAALAAITTAWLLVGLPIALLGQPAFPRLAAYAEASEWRQFRRTLLHALGVTAALAVLPCWC